MAGVARTACGEDMPAMEAVFHECFPPGWSFGKGVMGIEYDHLVLVIADSIVGFAALAPKKLYIAHMAVMPQFRAHTLTLWEAMLKAMLVLGDIWTVSCRPNTMYKFLLKRQGAGQVSFVTDSAGKEVNGEIMREVAFKIITSQ